MAMKAAKPAKVEVTKEQARRLVDAGDRLRKRAKRPAKYQANAKDVAEVERLTEALHTAIDRIIKKP
jgi:hypothetical protein